MEAIVADEAPEVVELEARELSDAATDAAIFSVDASKPDSVEDMIKTVHRRTSDGPGYCLARSCGCRGRYVCQIMISTICIRSAWVLGVDVQQNRNR